MGFKKRKTFATIQRSGTVRLELAKDKLEKEKLLKNKSSLLRKIQGANILVVHCNGRLKVAKEKIVSIEGRARKARRKASFSEVNELLTCDGQHFSYLILISA